GSDHATVVFIGHNRQGTFRTNPRNTDQFQKEFFVPTLFKTVQEMGIISNHLVDVNFDRAFLTTVAIRIAHGDGVTNALIFQDDISWSNIGHLTDEIFKHLDFPFWTYVPLIVSQFRQDS